MEGLKVWVGEKEYLKGKKRVLLAPQFRCLVFLVLYNSCMLMLPVIDLVSNLLLSIANTFLDLVLRTKIDTISFSVVSFSFHRTDVDLSNKNQGAIYLRKSTFSQMILLPITRFKKVVYVQTILALIFI